MLYLVWDFISLLQFKHSVCFSLNLNLVILKHRLQSLETEIYLATHGLSVSRKSSKTKFLKSNPCWGRTPVKAGSGLPDQVLKSSAEPFK